MKILDRYLFTSILKPLLFCVASFLILWLIYDLFDTLPDFINPHAPKGLIFEFYLVQLPKIAQSVIPVAFLFTTIYVMAYMSSHRELIVMQANGLNLAQISWPFFFIATVLTILLFFLNFNLTPRAEVNRRILKEQIQGIPSEALVFKNVIYRNPDNGNMWYLQKINARDASFQNGEILILNPNGRDQQKLFAKEGKFENGYWNLKNIYLIRFAPDGAPSQTIEIPEMTAYELTETPKQMVASLRRADEMTWRELWAFISSPSHPPSTALAPYLTENYYRMASPFVCIVLCFFGVALGITHARHNIVASVFNCIFVLFALLVWQQLSLALGSGSRIPAFLAGWSGILIFGAVGFYLFAHHVGWVWLWHSKWQQRGN